MDRRYLRTEKYLIEAMLTLIESRTFQDITISHIVDQADIARKTFYAHYENKHELLWDSLETHFLALEGKTDVLNVDTLLMDNKPLSYPIFAHVAQYKLFYTDMFTSNNHAPFVLQFLDYLAQKSYEKHQPLRDIAPQMTVPAELIAKLLAGALVGSLRWWLNEDIQDSPEQMAYRFSQIVAPGVLQSMGLPSF